MTMALAVHFVIRHSAAASPFSRDPKGSACRLREEKKPALPFGSRLNGALAKR